MEFQIDISIENHFNDRKQRFRSYYSIKLDFTASKRVTNREFSNLKKIIAEMKKYLLLIDY